MPLDYATQKIMQNLEPADVVPAPTEWAPGKLFSPLATTPAAAKSTRTSTPTALYIFNTC